MKRRKEGTVQWHKKPIKPKRISEKETASGENTRRCYAGYRWTPKRATNKVLSAGPRRTQETRLKNSLISKRGQTHSLPDGSLKKNLKPCRCASKNSRGATKNRIFFEGSRLTQWRPLSRRKTQKTNRGRGEGKQKREQNESEDQERW